MPILSSAQRLTPFFAPRGGPRPAQGGAWMPLDTRETLAFTMVRVALSLLVLTTAAVAPPERRRYVFITCVVCALAYLPGIAVVNYFKYSVADYECHYHDTSRANAVSGHAFYYAWVLASFQYCAHLLDHVMAAPADGEGASPAFISWLLLVFSLLCLAPQAFFTYYYGYHSLQQILLGAIFVRPRARRA